MDEHDGPVEEVRRTRERISARFDHDAEKYGEYLSEYQKKFGDRLVLLPDGDEPGRPRPEPAQEIPPAECCDSARLDDGYSDPSLEEIWTIREGIAAEFDYDLKKMARFHMEYQKQFGDRVVPPPAEETVADHEEPPG
jgi:hypothetical protein